MLVSVRQRTRRMSAQGQIRTSGRDRVEATLRQAIAPFRLANGAYRLENRFRHLLATRG